MSSAEHDAYFDTYAFDENPVDYSESDSSQQGSFHPGLLLGGHCEQLEHLTTVTLIAELDHAAKHAALAAGNDCPDVDRDEVEQWICQMRALRDEFHRRHRLALCRSRRITASDRIHILQAVAHAQNHTFGVVRSLR